MNRSAKQIEQALKRRLLDASRRKDYHGNAMNEMKCPKCGFSYYLNSCTLVYGLVLSCWHCITLSVYSSSASFVVLKEADTLCLRCGTIVTPGISGCECRQPALKAIAADTTVCQPPSIQAGVRRIPKSRSEQISWTGQLNEMTSLLDPGQGDAVCSDSAYPMQPALRHAEYASAPYGDAVQTGHNAGSAYAVQSYSCGYW